MGRLLRVKEILWEAGETSKFKLSLNNDEEVCIFSGFCLRVNDKSYIFKNADFLEDQFCFNVLLGNYIFFQVMSLNTFLELYDIAESIDFIGYIEDFI